MTEEELHQINLENIPTEKELTEQTMLINDLTKKLDFFIDLSTRIKSLIEPVKKLAPKDGNIWIDLNEANQWLKLHFEEDKIIIIASNGISPNELEIINKLIISKS